MAGQQATGERRVDYLPLHEIARAARNPKRHAASAIGASIGRFGLGELPLLDERTGRLVAGHGRLDDLTARHDAGEEPPDGVRVADNGAWLVPVIRGWASRSDPEADAYLVASNQLTVAGGWDDTELADLLTELAAADPDLLAVTGFDEDALSDLLAAGEDPGPPVGLTDPDDVPDSPAKAVTRRGDVWLCGRHRVACIDSTAQEEVAQLMGDARADCMWTDPPYGIEYVGKTKNALTIQNDDSQGLLGLLVDAFTTAGKVALRPGAAVYVAHAPGPLGLDAMQAFVGVGWTWRQNLVWVKDVFVLGHSDYQYRHEPIIFGYAAGAKGRRGRGGDGWYGDHSQTSVFDVPRPKRSEAHPTMKPVDLITAMLANSCPPAGTVYDPFGGSGSTLLAAHRLGLTAYLGELDERYVDTILRRFQEHTGVVPLLEATGEPHDFTDAEPG